MAGVFRRRKGLIFKFIIGVPILWFSSIGFMVVISGGGIPDINSVDAAGERIGRGRHKLRYDSKLTKLPENVIEVPNPDRLHFEESVKRDAMVVELEDRGNDDGRRKLNDIGDEDGHNRETAFPKRTRLKSTDNPKNWNNRPTKGVNKTQLEYEAIEVVFHLPPDEPNGPGAKGKAVYVDKNELDDDERRKYDAGWKKNAFNQYASDKISLHRSLPDVRDSGCKRVEYRPVEELPDTSVIICFHNEAWTVLLRTVHSVLDRSPPSLIKEILLVDDYSDMPHLKSHLENYIEKLGKVRVVRTKRREGLIRARLLGASVAQGTVLTYLDSHCEATEGWLEPLLDRIAENKSNVVTPVIDVIDDETLKYQYSSAQSTSVGGFDWNLQFNWHGIPHREKRRRKRAIDPVRSPTMAGGLFSISKEYFEYLGAYDPGMDIWGGENLELSFRVWMCGGSLEIIPCSHVGHIFRKRSPYSWKSGVNVVKKNSVRLAEVWMDDYKKYYYERFNNDLGNYGDVSARKVLREKLQCKGFDWYINNVFPELFIPGDALASGEIRNGAKDMCLDSSADTSATNKPVKMWPCHNQGGNQIQSAFRNPNGIAMCIEGKLGYPKDKGRKTVLARCLPYTESQSPLDRNPATSGCLDAEDIMSAKDRNIKNYHCHGMGGHQIRNIFKPQCLDSAVDKNAMNKAVKMWPCHRQGGNQYWMLSKEGEIRRDEGCMDYAGQFVMMYPCHGMKGNQEWVYEDDGSLRHKNSNLCIEMSSDGQKVDMKACNGNDRQKWQWNRKNTASSTKKS